VSISQTFYEQVFSEFPFFKKLQTQTVSKEMLHKLQKYLYTKKAKHKMLVKLTPVVKKFCQHFIRGFFANILLPKNNKHNLKEQKSCTKLFPLKKNAYKMLVKLI